MVALVPVSRSLGAQTLGQVCAWRSGRFQVAWAHAMAPRAQMTLARREFLALASGAALAGVSRPAAAQTYATQAYPTRNVRIIVPFGPASGTDIVARLFADRL